MPSLSEALDVLEEVLGHTSKGSLGCSIRDMTRGYANGLSFLVECGRATFVRRYGGGRNIKVRLGPLTAKETGQLVFQW